MAVFSLFVTASSLWWLPAPCRQQQGTPDLCLWPSVGMVGLAFALTRCCHHSESLHKEADKQVRSRSFRHRFEPWMPPSSTSAAAGDFEKVFGTICWVGWIDFCTDVVLSPFRIVAQRSWQKGPFTLFPSPLRALGGSQLCAGSSREL